MQNLGKSRQETIVQSWGRALVPLRNMLLLLSCSVMSDSLRLHGLQHARLPCPSLSPRVCSNSCQGIYITISLSSSAGTKAPTQVKDGNFRLSIRFLRFPVALTSNFTYFKTSPPKPSGNSGFLSRSQASSFQSTAIKLSLLQTLDILVYLYRVHKKRLGGVCANAYSWTQALDLLKQKFKWGTQESAF